jgi:hypothetical protein
VDGAEQRYRDYSRVLHEWEIRLDLLDEAEMALVEAFVSVNQGTYGHFGFTDPWDGTVYPDCSLVEDRMVIQSVAEMAGSTALRIRENR